MVSAKLYFPKDVGLYYCNGFQSWTDSGLLNKNEKVDRMRFLGKVANHAYNLKTFGDYDFVEQSRLYSHTYTYIQNSENITLYAKWDIVGYIVTLNPNGGYVEESTFPSANA